MKNRSKTAPCDYCTPLGGGNSGGLPILDDSTFTVTLDGNKLCIEHSDGGGIDCAEVEITNCPMCGETL